MPPRLMRDAAKERYWRRVFSNWKASGISIAEYCRLNDIKYPSFAKWRRKIRLGDGEVPAGKSAGSVGSEVDDTTDSVWPPAWAADELKSNRKPSRRRTHAKVQFREVQVIEPQPRPEDSADISLEVLLPSGVTLRLRQGCSMELLSSVVSALENR